MLELGLPWVLLLLPAPLLLSRLLPAYREEREAIRTPFFGRLVELTGAEPSLGAVELRPSWPQRLLILASWSLIVLALARPQWVEDPITKIEAARDLMLAVDLSGSMEARDFVDPTGERIDRLTAVQQVLDDFISRRGGDRIGLLFFGTKAYLQVPFTLDHETCRALLQEAQTRMAGPQTAIGDAIGLSVKLFESTEQEERVLILLTDGNDTSSLVPPSRAAAIAADADVTIHTIAIGDPATVGEQEIDEDALREVAVITGGEFFRALDRDQLAGIYDRLDELTPEEHETLSYRPRTPLYHWPLGAALVLVLSFHTLSALRRWRPRKAATTEAL